MTFFKGHPPYVTKKSVDHGKETRQYNLLKDAKKKYNGKQVIGKFGSIIDWDSLCLKRINNRTRRFALVICGKCKKPHYVNFHNLVRQMKKTFYTGCCKPCVDHMSWTEEGRPRVEKRKSTNHGYIKIYIPENQMSDKRGEVYEHRLVMSKILGRPLEKWEHVHHKDGDKTNNEPKNLELHPNSEHATIKDMKYRISFLESILKQNHISIPK